MRGRDLAVLTFRAVALWPIVSGLTEGLETVIMWDVTYSELSGEASPARLPVSPLGVFARTMLACIARVLVGVLLWASSGLLAQVAVGPDRDTVPLPDRRTLYLGAMFLVGVWLLASAVPTAAYWLFWAVRTGWRPQHPEHGAQLAELAVRGLVGASLLRGEWLLPPELRSSTAEDTAEPGHEADDTRDA